MTITQLDREMRRILIGLEMVSHGTTAAIGGLARPSENPDPTPNGGAGAEHIYWTRRYGPPFHICTRTCSHAKPADDDNKRRDVIEQAANELAQLRGHGIDRSNVVGEPREQEEARMLKEGAGFTPNEVALRFNCTPTRVRDVRRQHHYSVEKGTPPADVANLDRHRTNVQRMANDGYTVRQIEDLTKVPRRTIYRWLKEAA